jgi:hypothetical protein
MFQDPTVQAEIDDFMVQQLDGTSNDWGWCKQKVLKRVTYYAAKLTPCTIRTIVLTSLISFKAWGKCYSCGITCCVQSWSYGEEDSSLPGLLNVDMKVLIVARLRFQRCTCTEISFICSILQTWPETRPLCSLYLLLM